jgi:hypothetical protein
MDVTKMALKKFSAYRLRFGVKNEKQVSKVFIKDKEVAGVRLDPYRETADVNEENQNWPQMPMPSKFQLFKASGLAVVQEARVLVAMPCRKRGRNLNVNRQS